MSDRVELPRAERCETCCWWKCAAEVGPEPDGECRRHAPVRLTAEGGDDGLWPWTTELDWCGEWKAIPEIVQTQPSQDEEEFAKWMTELSTRTSKAVRRASIGTFDALLSTATKIDNGRLVYAVFPKKWKQFGLFSFAELQAAVARSGRTPPAHWQQTYPAVKAIPEQPPPTEG